MYDLLVQGAHVLDGSGGPGFQADLAVTGSQIAAVGRTLSGEAVRTISADGLYLAPAWIDLHSHSDLGLLRSPFEPNKLSQGIGCEVAGNCGFSLFPISDAGRPAVEALAKSYGLDISLPWSRAAEFFDLHRKMGIGVNYLPLVGHGILRLNTMGSSAQAAGNRELDAMGALLEEALQEGAWGFSSGLAYMPGCFAGSDEILHLARIAARYNGIYTTHIRDQGKELLQSVDEAIEIAEKSGVSVVISHLKAYGLSNWGKARRALDRIADARARGVRCMADFYPYDSAESTLMYEFPSWAKEGGLDGLLARLSDENSRDRIRRELEEGDISWDRLIIASPQRPENGSLLGKSIAETAFERGEEPLQTARGLLESEGGGLTLISQLMSEDDLDDIASSDFVAVGSDAYAQDPQKPFFGHPRNWGAFPRFYRRYVREKGILSPEQAVYKMSGMAAKFLGMEERGRIEKGMKADFLLFDPQDIGDEADYQVPDRPSRGVHALFINGVQSLDSGHITHKPVGEILLARREN